jgi:ABC-2 type transport system ATP-binding protein
MLKSLQGVAHVEALGERDGDSFTYRVESSPNIDIRKILFHALADHGWPMIGMEAVGMDLEDIFIKLVDNKKA